MNPIRTLVAQLGGIVKTAERYGVGKSLIGACCQSGHVYSLELALAMAADVHATDAARLAWLESVSPKRRAA
jgi:hypothetical protein